MTRARLMRFVAALFASIATWMVLRRSRQAQILQNEKEAAVRQDEREVWAMKQGAIEHRKTEQ